MLQDKFTILDDLSKINKDKQFIYPIYLSDSILENEVIYLSYNNNQYELISKVKEAKSIFFIDNLNKIKKEYNIRQLELKNAPNYNSIHNLSPVYSLNYPDLEYFYYSQDNNIYNYDIKTFFTINNNLIDNLNKILLESLNKIDNNIIKNYVIKNIELITFGLEYNKSKKFNQIFDNKFNNDDINNLVNLKKQFKNQKSFIAFINTNFEFSLNLIIRHLFNNFNLIELSNKFNIPKLDLSILTNSTSKNINYYVNKMLLEVKYDLLERPKDAVQKNIRSKFLVNLLILLELDNYINLEYKNYRHYNNQVVNNIFSIQGDLIIKSEDNNLNKQLLISNLLAKIDKYNLGNYKLDITKEEYSYKFKNQKIRKNHPTFDSRLKMTNVGFKFNTILDYYLIHGLTGTSDKYDSLKRLDSVIEHNGLLSNYERRRLNIEVKSLSPIGDITSGIDHGVALNFSFKRNYGKYIYFIADNKVLKYNKMWMAPYDFGSGSHRNQKFKEYHNEISNFCSNTNMYSPSLKTRYNHISDPDLTPTNEIYIENAIYLEEIKYILFDSHYFTKEEIKSLYNKYKHVECLPEFKLFNPDNDLRYYLKPKAYLNTTKLIGNTKVKFEDKIDNLFKIIEKVGNKIDDKLDKY